MEVIIPVKNEEINLPHALASVKEWADRVWVVDCGSTDSTCQIAKEAGADVVVQ
ncbi:MAG TPA: glycosyltransferase, partial [Phycisphaerales bacterium]|nr:glycosyltransferase [Phycisphaerales bacterium]